ncbi:hypothetical protein D3874_17420 [Oleomonas cavernae]|uniref:Periplasmic heavy metal sensor n=1 Tax=Oleomonas cavernae TaxID=2320859 RepID=A0A418WEW4_9PROT|nr:Spy/CpxP family protein refolding chaperone [Oleomonas cavernae]RJF88563.1 hypothetical protein D3874_17420 [Oleomonas cavernae]
MKTPFLATLGLLATVGAVALGAGISAAETTPPAAGGKPAHAMRAQDPDRMADRCQTRFAFEAGRLAFLEARLDLTPAQKPLWDAYKTAAATADAKTRDDCVAAVPAKAEAEDKTTIVDRETMKIQRLEAELANLKATQPALAALYPTLTAKQQEIIDQPPRHGRHGGMTRARFEQHDRHGDSSRGPGGAPTPLPPPALP